MNGRSHYGLRSFGRLDMVDEVDGSTGSNQTVTSGPSTCPASNHGLFDNLSVAPEVNNCSAEVTDGRSIDTPVAVSSAAVSTSASSSSSARSSSSSSSSPSSKSVAVAASTSGSVTISNVSQHASEPAFVQYNNVSDMMDSKGSKLNIYELLNLKKAKVKPVPNPVPALSQTPDNLDYHMDHERRGRCLIINNRHFNCPTLHERKGTEVDGRHLVQCFKKLDFEIDLVEDKKVKDIHAAINRIASQDFSNDDCFVCCVLTHGDLNTLWARDERYVLDLILEPFRGDNCKTLAGKPKLFFIQACQGDKLDGGMTVRFDDVEDSTPTTFFRIPTWADFLVAFSTVPGYYSWRNTTNGSWFVQALVKTLEEHWKTHDLLSMLTMASHRVAYHFESYVPNNEEFDKKKQVPCIKSMLTRRIYFKPKAPVLLSARTEDKTELLIKLLNEKSHELKTATDSQAKIQHKINTLNQEISLIQQHLHQILVQQGMQKLNVNGIKKSVSTNTSSVSTTTNITSSSSGCSSSSSSTSNTMIKSTVANMITRRNGSERATTSGTLATASTSKIEIVQCKSTEVNKSAGSSKI